MDENPLVGEPGSFIIQKTRDKPTTRHIAPGSNDVEPTERTTNELDTKPAPLPMPPLKTDLPIDFGKKIKGGEKSPLTPGGGKKRKKSKVVTPRTPK